MSRDLTDEYLKMKDRTERLRSHIEEKNLKNLDPLLAHTGNNPKMQALDGLRNWWLTFALVGKTDPPNNDMEFLGEYKVNQIEWSMSAHAASADVYHDETIERRRPVYFGGSRGLRGLGGLDADEF